MILIYTPDQVLRIGLKLIGVSTQRQQRQLPKTNLHDFSSHFGTDPGVCAKIWEDLQTTTIAEAQLDASLKGGANIKNFLRSCHFLKRYKTEQERKVDSGNSKKTVRKWTWFFLAKIKALREQKIVWPDNWTSNFIISMDGVHCNYHEEKHPTLSKNPALFSHKYNGPGLMYELALSLYDSKLVWLKGPISAGTSDLAVYKSDLKQRIPVGKKIIVDRGYRDKKDPRLVTPNSHDSPELQTFKARARMRQEAFHTRLKRFDCLTDEFRHDRVKHGLCFESVCVIVCYEMEMGKPMWDV
jgi:hypothetical protein